MNKPHCYRALIMRVTEIEVEIWADSYEHAVELAHYENENTFNVESKVHVDEIVEIFPYEEDYQC